MKRRPRKRSFSSHLQPQEDVWWFTDSKVGGPPRGSAFTGHTPAKASRRTSKAGARGVSVKTADGATYHADLLYPALGCEGRYGPCD